MARSSAYALAVVLIDRVLRAAARASAPTWSTPGRPSRNRRRRSSDEVTSARLSTPVSVVVTRPSLIAFRPACFRLYTGTSWATGPLDPAGKSRDHHALRLPCPGECEAAQRERAVPVR